ncbi:hypothetical protein ACF046_12035 [Glutamicibacter creatinolyticus]|uniref:PH-like domain-containing protein n=1 Tax=Glutamicibacter TaxID=1742989 RepID=UPI0020177C0B|nr:hypothetical protein [Glutamicibacter sp. V16R2B1]
MIDSPYFVPIAWTLGIILVLLLLIAVGWRNRKRRQSGVPAPFQDFADTEVARFEGMYVATTRGEDWLDRIAVHQLGVRTNADLVIGERGVHFMRAGARAVHVPFAALTRVNRASGMAGKFVEDNGLVITGWVKDDFDFDTGFRPRYHADNAKIYQMLASHLDDAADQETN